MEARQRGWEELRNGAEPSSREDLGPQVPQLGVAPHGPALCEELKAPMCCGRAGMPLGAQES